jgi:cytochrome c peroxidase
MKQSATVVLLVSAAWVVFRADAIERNGTINLGERLFLETRFSQFFFAKAGENASFKLSTGDPVMATTATIYGPLPGPFAGESMNCRACHLVDEQERFGNRTFADFAPRSPVPAIGDGRMETPRNAISLVDALVPRDKPLFLHYDGQFAHAQDLIVATWTGRNFGWKPADYATAISHIAHIIRQDDGTGGLAREYGGWSYARVFAGGKEIESQYQVSPAYRLADVTITNTADPKYVSDQQIVQNAAALIQAYLESLVFSRDASGLFDGSPYDVFLIKNGLPREPGPGETPLQYSQRLLQLIESSSNLQFVTDPADGHFETHSQKFQFGPTELAGLKIFFANGSSATGVGTQTATGNCVTCHPPPRFTDFLFHNTSAAQEEYDSIHGPGSFVSLSIPDLATRQNNYDAYLPATTNHPSASGTFAAPATLTQPGQVDLGLWNVFANPDFPAPQSGLQQILPQLVPTPTPRIEYAKRTGNDFVISGSNGTPGGTYYILASTNPALPPASWSIISTNQFDSAGAFAFTNLAPPNAHAFYMASAAGPTADQALPRMIALFKTPNLRDLGSSDPYFHTGRMNTLENVIAFYENFSNLARAGGVRNADPALSQIVLNNAAIAPLAAFLRSLNEDYLNPRCPCTPGASAPNQRFAPRGAGIP